MAEINDPFATPADEAQTEVAPEPQDTFDAPPADAPEPKKAPAKKAAPKRATKKLAEDEDEDAGDYPHSVTLKAGTGFDSPWIVLRGKTVEDLAEQFDGQPGSVLAKLMTRVAKAGEYFATQFSGQPAQPRGNGGGQRGGGAPQGAQEAPGGEKKFCKHGEMEFKSGVSKAGKAYQLFSCTAPRDEQCPAQYPDKKR